MYMYNVLLEFEMCVSPALTCTCTCIYMYVSPSPCCTVLKQTSECQQHSHPVTLLMSEPVSSDCDCATGSYGCRYWDQGWLPQAECHTLPLARAVIVASLSVPMHVHVYIYISTLYNDCFPIVIMSFVYCACTRVQYVYIHTMYVDVIMLKLMIADADSLQSCVSQATSVRHHIYLR